MTDWSWGADWLLAGRPDKKPPDNDTLWRDRPPLRSERSPDEVPECFGNRKANTE